MRPATIPLLLILTSALLALYTCTQSVRALELVEIGSMADYERFALGDEYHAALIFFYASWDKRSMAAKKKYVEAAEEMTNQHIEGLVMGLVDAGRHPKIAKKIGVHGFPSMFLYQFGTHPQHFAYSFDDNFNTETIMEFALHETGTHRDHLKKLRDAHDEKERTHYDFPHPNPGAVIELNAHNFNRVIRDPTKTGFVMFYAEWCEICQNTFPEVKRIAEHFKGDTNVVIGRLEVDNEKEWMESNGFEIEGVPAFWLFPRGRRDKERGWQYLGERNFDGMSVYVKSHSNKPEEDLHDFHKSIIQNKPDDKNLPEHMRGSFSTDDAMPSDIFNPKDGRPYGDELAGMKPIHPTNKLSDARSKHAHKFDPKTGKRLINEDEDDDGTDLTTLTHDERQARVVKKQKQQSQIDRGGNPMGMGKLPPELKGKLD